MIEFQYHPQNFPIMEKINALFVDDDPSLLAGLRRSLRRKTRDWDIRFAESGQEALELLNITPADVVISDMRMPKMNGVELLDEVKERYPNTVRFVLSGFSDKKMILNSVGLTHQFFAKPCDPEHLIQAVIYSNSLYKHLNSSHIQRIVCGTKNLPTPPETYNRINSELRREDPSVERISEIVKQDSAISAKILQLVNSAFFGIGGSVADISQATMYLGIENLKSLVLVVGLGNENFKKINQNFPIELYTAHSIEVGTLSEKIARALGMAQKETQTAFTAGLLHDIGKLVMATHFLGRYSQKRDFKMQTPDTAHIQDLEDREFGTNHADIGAALIGLWGLPPHVVNAVAFHHKPLKDVSEVISYAGIIHAANAIVLHRDENNPGSLLESDLLDREFVESKKLGNQILDWVHLRKEE